MLKGQWTESVCVIYYVVRIIMLNLLRVEMSAVIELVRERESGRAIE